MDANLHLKTEHSIDISAPPPPEGVKRRARPPTTLVENFGFYYLRSPSVLLNRRCSTLGYFIPSPIETNFKRGPRSSLSLNPLPPHIPLHPLTRYCLRKPPLPALSGWIPAPALVSTVERCQFSMWTKVLSKHLISSISFLTSPPLAPLLVDTQFR